ncbi:MAG: nucleotidyltransferase family protein [Acidobacteria bacterium]|nr:nucleotidyltransferase family protein [Acidobacteriota bacterium]
MTTAAIVLAAGAASRFGGHAGDKLLAIFRGRPLVVWAVDAALAAGLDEVIVVTGAADLAGVVDERARLVANPDWAAGQATSLAVGVDAAAAAGHDAVVVGLGDQPLVPAEAWRLVGADGSAPIVVATYGGERRNPVRFSREVWDLLPREGDEGARSVLRSRPQLVAEVACPGDPADVDTREDLARWS